MVGGGGGGGIRLPQPVVRPQGNLVVPYCSSWSRPPSRPPRSASRPAVAPTTPRPGRHCWAAAPRPMLPVRQAGRQSRRTRPTAGLTRPAHSSGSTHPCCACWPRTHWSLVGPARHKKNTTPTKITKKHLFSIS